MVVQGMHAVQSHHRAIMRNVELMVASGAKFPCLTSQYTALHRAHIAAGSTQLSQLAQRSANNRVLSQLRHRFRLYKSKHKLRRYTLMLIDYAYENFWTTTYAKFQLLTNGIVP
jgi:phosphatidylinositol kinase/protein kinase (PI-3  family)